MSLEERGRSGQKRPRQTIKNSLGPQNKQRKLEETFSSKDFPVRPRFSRLIKTINRELAEKIQGIPRDKNLQELGLASTHRLSYKSIKTNTLEFLNGKHTKEDFLKWTSAFERGLKNQNEQYKLQGVDNKILQKRESKGCDFIKKRDALIGARDEFYNNKLSKDMVITKTKSFLKSANEVPSNIALLGSQEINSHVGSKMHPNFVERSPTPQTRELLSLDRKYVAEGIATTSSGDKIITILGKRVPLNDLPMQTREQVKKVGLAPVNGLK